MKLGPQDLEKISRVTLEHYNRHAEQFWEGTRDHDVSHDHNAVVALCLLGSDHAAEHILDYARRIAGTRIAKAAAPRQLQADGVPWWDGLPSFWPNGQGPAAKR